MGLQIERLKALRKQKGMKQIDLANAMHISRSTLAMWEAGRSEPTGDMYAMLSFILGCTVGYLMGTEDEVQPADDDIWTLREEERRDPNRKALYMLAKYGTAQDIRQATAIIDALKATNPDYYDGDDPA